MDGRGHSLDEGSLGSTEVVGPEPVQREQGISSLEQIEREARRDALPYTGRSIDNSEAENAASTTSLDEQESRRAGPHGHDGTGDEHKLGNETQNDDIAQHSPVLTELYTISWLTFFSFWGTLARLGAEAITLYPNAPVSSRVLWANLGGSFVLGLLTEDRQLFREEWGNPRPDTSSLAHGKVKKTIPLYIGLATGFCGCFTSFSSFMRDAFLALSNALESPSPKSPYHVDMIIASRNGGFSFLALLAILILHPAISLAALKTGGHAALLIQPVTPVLPFRLVRRFLDPIAVLLAFGCWIGVVFLSAFPPDNASHWRVSATLPLVFAPVGCVLRFYTSKHLNALIPNFPLGTFGVNIFGTMLLGMAWDLQHARRIGVSSQIICSILQGIMEGFCGCLTTVSTWVLELQGLRPSHGWLYGLISIGVGLAFMVIIMGSMAWTVGFARPVCS